MPLNLDALRLNKAPASPSAAEVEKMRAALAPGQPPIVPIRLQATYGEGGLMVEYALFVINQPNLQITTVSAVVQTGQQQVVGLQTNVVGQVGNLGNTGGWGGQWALSGIDAYAGQTLTVTIVGECSLNGATPQHFGPFQTTVQIPRS